MASELTGLRVAFLTASEGVERVELTAPWQAVRDADGIPELLAPERGEVHRASTIWTNPTPLRCIAP